MNRRILAVLGTAVVLSAGGIAATSNGVSAETVEKCVYFVGAGVGLVGNRRQCRCAQGSRHLRRRLAQIARPSRGRQHPPGAGAVRRRCAVRHCHLLQRRDRQFLRRGGLHVRSADHVGPPQGQCRRAPAAAWQPAVTLATVAGPGTVTVTGQTSDSHPGHATQGQTGEQVGIFAVPIGGGPEIVIIAATDDVSESSDDPPPVLFNASATLGRGRTRSCCATSVVAR